MSAQRHVLAISIKGANENRAERNDDVWLQQSRRNMQSSDIIKQEAQMMYGNIDVVESQKGRKRKRSFKILIFFFLFQKTSTLLVAACRYFESGNKSC